MVGNEELDRKVATALSGKFQWWYAAQPEGLVLKKIDAQEDDE